MNSHILPKIVWRSLVTVVAGLALSATPAYAAATVTYPADGAVNADMSQPITWTAVQNVQAYYLYIGTTSGANNLVNSGETLQTSYLAGGLPTGQTLYITLWTKAGGSWSHSDSTFSAAPAAPVTATLTNPTNAATNVDLTLGFQWTSINNVQAYYLYVGTSIGSNNLVNSGEIQQTVYYATNLPANQTLYVRLWTKVANIWRSVDSTFSAAAVLQARLTFPLNGAVNADLTQAIRWTSVPNVQAYYLYVGTTVGTNNLVNTGETLQTSYLAGGLPAGQTLYARMWTKTGGVWRYFDSTFTAAASAPLVASLTYPTNGTTNADLSQTIQWTTVTGAQAYYLYVGTTLGASNLINSGETLQTSYLASGLPTGTTLYVRLWTRAGGIWRYVDSTFIATSSPLMLATLTNPVNGATNADLWQGFQWTSVPNVQAYYLYVGTTVGAKNLIDSQETLQTTYPVGAELPVGQTIYARLWTKAGNVWRYSDSTFSAAPMAATLITPANGAVGVDPLQPATWTSVTNVQAYYLYVGTTLGAKNVVDSHETQATSFSIAAVPPNQTLYARLWTKKANSWRYRDTTFTATTIGPHFVYPTDGATAVDLTQAFQWTPPANVQSNELRIGTTPGGSDLFDSGEIAGNSLVVPGLPSTGILYARVLSKVHNIWRHVDIAFTAEPTAISSTIMTPADGEPAFNTIQPFEWTASPLAHAYRLTLGTTIGGTDVHDSGEIHVSRRFVPSLPLGPLFGRLYTKIAGQWSTSDFTFTVVGNTVSSTIQIKNASWATDLVRLMAPADNRPASWTVLAQTIAPLALADCQDFANALLTVLREMNIQLSSRRVDVALNPNTYDGHTLVELLNPDTAQWMLLDPTFDLSIKRSSDQGYATAEDMSTATRNQQWNDVSYIFLGDAGDAFARSYYLDYPLLFVNVYHEGQIPVNGQGGPVLPYMLEVALPVSGAHEVYAAGCPAPGSTELHVDGSDRAIDCSGVDALSYVFDANSIAATVNTDPSVKVYSPRRFVF